MKRTQGLKISPSASTLFCFFSTELELCDDKKKLMKKKIRRGLKEGDAGYLQNASDSDSALEDSGSESGEADTEDTDNEASDDGLINEIKEMIEDLKQEGGNLLAALEWLKSCLDDEKADREDDDEDLEDVPLVPIGEECTSAMEDSKFTRLLKMIQMTAPNDQERFWRIPATITVSSLAEKSALLQKIMDPGEINYETFNVTLITGKAVATKEKKKKKREKRGPNKWMPMRRTVDSDVANRISDVLDQNRPPKSETKSKKEPKKAHEKKSTPRRKKILAQSDSSDDETNIAEGSDEEADKQIVPKSRSLVETDDSSNSDDAQSEAVRQSSTSKPAKKGRLINDSSSEGDEVTNRPLKITSRSLLDSSDSSEDDEKMEAAKDKSKLDDPKSMKLLLEDYSDSEEENKDKTRGKVVNRSRLDSSSSDDEMENPNPQDKQPSDNEEKKQTKENGEASEVLNDSSSSDEGVDDPAPQKRPPSDDDDPAPQKRTPAEAERQSRSRHSSTSSSLSSRSMISSRSSSPRSRSVSKSPDRSYMLSSANGTPRSPIRFVSLSPSSKSNTPKRLRSSPSPMKNGKKAKKLINSSDDDE